MQVVYCKIAEMNIFGNELCGILDYSLITHIRVIDICIFTLMHGDLLIGEAPAL